MASGSWHYAEAERLLAKAADASDKGQTADMAYWLECAQAHATLALAAATADPFAEGGDWIEAFR